MPRLSYARFDRLARIGPVEFVGSLGFLVFLTLLATILLIVDGNRPKALRVGLASGVYLLVLAGGHSVRRLRSGGSRTPGVWWFIAAGGAAGLVSGTVRPDATFRLALVQTAAAAHLLGGFHCWAIRMWRRLHARIAG